MRLPSDEPIVSDAMRVNILLVDDLPEKLSIYHAILDELDQTIITAQSGEEALKLVLRHEFAVILLDVNMPGMDGLETASLIRKRKRSAHTPIIFLTAFTDEIRMAQGYASGAVDYLPTPVEPEVLKAKVRVFIELSQMRRMAASQAEERALRTAAEKSARRSEFLVNATEIIVRSQSQIEILRALQQLPIPSLAEITVLCLASERSENIHSEWLRADAEGGLVPQPLAPDTAPFSMFDKVRREALAAGQPVVLADSSNAAFAQLSPALLESAEGKAGQFNAIAVPFTVKGFASGALILGRRSGDAYQPDEMTLANDLVSRVGIALENIILVKQIREADRRKNEFLAMLAHELRNPLAPIRNAVEVIKRVPHLREQVIETIERQVTHMVHLVDDLMDISRITQGKIDLRKETILLGDALNHAIETAQPLIKQHGHQLIADTVSMPIWLDADPARISQIFSNLLNNAAKYTDNNGIIGIKTEVAGRKVTITVSDNGIGISEDMLPYIFDMFSQVDSSLERAQGGLGIGLTLVKTMVEMHGGSITALSDGIGKGSRFIVEFPTITNKLPFIVEDTSTGNDDEITPLRVLIVDDNAASAQTLGWMVEMLGHQIQLAHDGDTAIASARSFHPDIVLLDIGLPGVSGYEVCKRMRQYPELSSTVFIAQTGWGQKEHRLLSKEAGFHHHLVKPIDMKMLQGIFTAQEN